MHIEEIPLFYDLLTLALQTDSTRVATFEIPMGFRTAELEVGSYHGLSHHSKSERAARAAPDCRRLPDDAVWLLPGQDERGTGIRPHRRRVGQRDGQRLEPQQPEPAGDPRRRWDESSGPHCRAQIEDHKRVPLSNLWLVDAAVVRRRGGSIR